MFAGPAVVLDDAVLHRDAELVRHDRGEEGGAVVRCGDVHPLMHADLDPDARSVAGTGVPSDLIGRQTLKYEIVIDRLMPGHLPVARILAFDVSCVGRGIRASIGIVGVVNCY